MGECKGVIEMNNGAMLHLGKTIDGKYKICAKDNLKKLLTDDKQGKKKDSAITKARIFTKKVLKVMQEEGPILGLKKLNFEVRGEGRDKTQTLRDTIKNLDEDAGRDEFVLVLNLSKPHHHLVLTKKRGYRRLVERRP